MSRICALRRAAPLVLFVMLLAGCGAYAGFKALFVSGVALDVVGDQFVAVSAQVNVGCTQQVIPAATCAKYRAFQVRFKQSYPLAVGMWQAANKAGDTVSKGKAEDVIRSLARDLSNLASEALQTFMPREGE